MQSSIAAASTPEPGRALSRRDASSSRMLLLVIQLAIRVGSTERSTPTTHVSRASPGSAGLGVLPVLSF
ncbi:MAG: hypothetical protein R3C97_02375 [Geminicoccaceae bacterium]